MAQTLNMLNMDADPMLHTAYHQFEVCQIESLQFLFYTYEHDTDKPQLIQS